MVGQHQGAAMSWVEGKWRASGPDEVWTVDMVFPFLVRVELKLWRWAACWVKGQHNLMHCQVAVAAYDTRW